VFSKRITALGNAAGKLLLPIDNQPETFKKLVRLKRIKNIVMICKSIDYKKIICFFELF